jgi:ACS family glucarate transporter-like MFS transporter
MNSTIDSLPAVQRPTRVRVAVVAALILLGMVTYLDRACISKLSVEIRSDLGLSDKEMAVVFTVFAVAYGAFGIPSARWADRTGTRLMLFVVVVSWSISTVLTGLAWGFVSMIVIRILFGIGEAGAWPAITRTLSRWIPYRERGTAQ